MIKMTWALTVLCLTVMGLQIVSLASKENEVKVIVDVLQTFNKPSHVVANLCWQKPKINNLVNHLGESKSPKSMKLVEEVDAKDLINKEQNIFLVDLACKGAVQFLSKAKNYFGKPYRWLVLNRPNAGNNVPAEMDAIKILTDSEVYVSQFGNSTYDVNLIYKISPNRDWIIEKYATWSTERGLIVSSHVMELVTAIRRRNLAQETVVTSMVITDNGTLDDLDLLQYPERDAVSKSGYKQLAPLYEFLNATRKLIFTNSWGQKTNGTWSGMLGHLYQEKADIPGSVMFITKERMKLIEFISFPTSATVKFLFREPPLSYQNNLYLLPFKASVWSCIGSFVVVLIAAMYVAAYWEAKKAGHDEKKEDETAILVPNVSDVTVFVMSAISQQGSNVELKGTLGRFVILILFLVFLFLYTAYSASIVVLLQSSSNQIRTLSDLLNSKLELGVEDTPYNRYWFTNVKDPIRKAIYEKKVAPSGTKPNFFEINDGILKLQAKPFAFNTHLGSAYKLIEKYFYEHEKCGLREIPYIQNSIPWQAVRRGSPYKEMFKLGLLRNAEFGLNDRFNRMLFSKKPVCSVRGGSFVSVSLVDCYPILLLLLYGMILGVLLLLAEVMHHRRMSASTRHLQPSNQ